MNPLARTMAGLAGGWVATHTFDLVSRLQSGGGHGSVAKKLQSRRTFTRNAALGAAGIVTLELAAGTVFLLWPNKTGAFGGDITVAAESVPEVQGEPYRDALGKFFIVHTDDGVEALYWKCVHLGCTVPWVSGQGQFICPCHGSVYEYNGNRVSGPAPRPLDAMPVTVNDDGSLTVNTNPSALIVRQQYQPEHATEYDV